MKTYVVRSATNYGEMVIIVNADDKQEVRDLVARNPYAWEGYTIEELNTSVKGITFFGGGDKG